MAEDTDYKQMAERLLPAAERGNSKAQYNLGVLYHSGKGVAKDFQQAFKWYRKAAEQGHMKAQYYCALLLYKGRGTAKNDEEAIMWLHKSAKQGNEDAKKALDKLLSVPDISIDELISGNRKGSEQTQQNTPSEESVSTTPEENESTDTHRDIGDVIGVIGLIVIVLVALIGGLYLWIIKDSSVTLEQAKKAVARSERRNAYTAELEKRIAEIDSLNHSQPVQSALKHHHLQAKMRTLTLHLKLHTEAQISKNFTAWE